MEELNHLLSVGPKGFETQRNGLALNNNIDEWFSNAEHTVADNAAWGHNLTPFLFGTHSENEAVMIEMAIVEKLPKDVKGLQLSHIKVEFSNIDLCEIKIFHQYGSYKKTLPLQA